MHLTCLSVGEAQLVRVLRCDLREGSESEGALDLAHVVVQDGLGAVGLRQVEAVVDLQTLAHRLCERSSSQEGFRVYMKK